MNALEFLNVQTDTVSTEKTIIRMPISDNIKQPYGIVHGGINAFLAETAASLGAQASLTDTNKVPVGVDIQTHHLASAKQGTLLTIAKPIKLGRRIQTWQVDIFIEETSKQTATATLTILITDKP